MGRIFALHIIVALIIKLLLSDLVYAQEVEDESPKEEGENPTDEGESPVYEGESPTDDGPIDEEYVKNYLTWKGYMSDENTFEEALEHYQEYMGANITGDMNEQTWHMMKGPQCGVPDIINGQGTGLLRQKRYELAGSSFWPKTTLSYRIVSLPRSIQDKQGAQNQIHQAFQDWQRASNLRFVQQTGKARSDFEVHFAVRQHKDPGRPYPFDGRGTVLAHAFFPRVGQIHFDDDERWTLDRSGTNLRLVAVHEIGHALGLQHSIRNSIMFAAYQSHLDPNNPLHADDVAGIRQLYGPFKQVRNNPVRITLEPGVRNPNPPTRSPPPDLCHDPRIDAITTTMDGTVYIFRDNYYWVLLPSGLQEGYPKQILSDWPGLPDNIDAALTTEDGMTHFFKGDKFWSFINREALNEGQNINQYFPRVPSNVTAAFIWPSDGLLHFIQGSDVWRYRYKSSYNARKVTNLNTLNIHEPIGAAFTLANRRTFFFQGRNYYLIDTKTARVSPGYPQDTANNFFGCNRNQLSEMASLNDSINIYGVGGQDTIEDNVNSGSPLCYLSASCLLCTIISCFIRY